MKMGVVGLGQFAPEFIQLFRAHPGVSGIAICDVRADRVASIARDFAIEETYSDFDELLASDVDSVAIFTQRWLHGAMTIRALERGKNVFAAVPMAASIEEVEHILALVQSTGLSYMTAETSYYYPAVVYCREKWRDGRFGRFVYGEAEYLHDMSNGFYEAFQFSGGAEWKATASYPPMFYPTHSLSSVLSVTDAHATSVSCIGFRDTENDGVFDREVSAWQNDFSNEMALFATSDGGALRINELRRVGVPGRVPATGRFIPENRISVFGTRGSFEQQTEASVWQELDAVEDVTEILRAAPVDSSITASTAPGGVSEKLLGSFRSGFAPVHATDDLPEEFAGLHNGHEGSHQFLVHEFVDAVTSGRLPALHAWNAARWCVPGLVAHQSAVEGGTRVAVPDYGDAPSA
jgi:predicted dehydrogenase